MGIPHFAPDRYVGGVIDETAIRARFDAMRVRLDERERWVVRGGGGALGRIRRREDRGAGDRNRAAARSIAA